MKLLDGIKTHFTGASSLTDFGAPYFGVLPENFSLPAARISQITGLGPVQTLDGKYVHREYIQITLFHSDLDALETYQDAVKTRFDRQTFSVNGGTLIGCQLTNCMVNTQHVVKDTGEPVYAAMTEWLMQVDRSR